MKSLYMRDFSDEVVEALKERAAARGGRSLSAYVATELARIAARPTNAQIVERLRDRDRSAGPTARDPRRGRGRPSAIVIDASAMFEALVGRDVDTELLDALFGEVAAPHPRDVEVLSVLRGLALGG